MKPECVRRVLQGACMLRRLAVGLELRVECCRGLEALLERELAALGVQFAALTPGVGCVDIEARRGASRGLPAAFRAPKHFSKCNKHHR